MPLFLCGMLACKNLNAYRCSFGSVYSFGIRVRDLWVWLCSLNRHSNSEDSTILSSYGPTGCILCTDPFIVLFLRQFFFSFFKNFSKSLLLHKQLYTKKFFIFFLSKVFQNGIQFMFYGRHMRTIFQKKTFFSFFLFEFKIFENLCIFCCCFL